MSKPFSEAPITKQVYKLLDKNPLLTAKYICEILHLPYPKYKSYVSKLRHHWRRLPHNERGSKCSSHAWRGWTYLVKGVGRDEAVGLGWLRTRARNRWILWRDKLGRLEWFETDRVNVYVRKPANLGKAYQLLCNAFSWTGLITDLKILQTVLTGLRFKGAHYVFETKQALPRLTIDLFGKSNGIVIKVGDRSHPNAVEILATYPDWGEKNERLFEKLFEALSSIGNGGVPKHIQDRDPVGVR